MFAQDDHAKAYRQKKLVKSGGWALNYEIYTGFAGYMLVREHFDIPRVLKWR